MSSPDRIVGSATIVAVAVILNRGCSLENDVLLREFQCYGVLSMQPASPHKPSTLHCRHFFSNNFPPIGDDPRRHLRDWGKVFLFNMRQVAMLGRERQLRTSHFRFSGPSSGYACPLFPNSEIMF